MHRTRGLIGLVFFVPLVAGCVGVTSATLPSRAIAPAASPLPTASVAPAVSATPRPPVDDPTLSMEPTVSTRPKPTADPLPKGAITAEKAMSKIGTVAIVCGTVKDAKYATSSTGAPTFLNLARPYPNSPMTIVIWQEDRGAFAIAPEKAFLGKLVCIHGFVESYNGHAQITSAGGDVFLASEYAG
jgi:hypothetical protein